MHGYIHNKILYTWLITDACNIWTAAVDFVWSLPAPSYWFLFGEFITKVIVKLQAIHNHQRENIIKLMSTILWAMRSGGSIPFSAFSRQNTGSWSLQELCTMRAFDGWDVWSFVSDRTCMVYGFILVSGLGHVGSNYSSTHFLRFWTIDRLWSPNLSPAKIIMDPLGNTKTNLLPLPSSRTPITCPQRSKRQDGRQSKDR